MPQYVLFIRDDGDATGSYTPEQWKQHFDAFVAWSVRLHDDGKLAGVERLAQPSNARTVRNRKGEMVVDGPFVEGKEAVLGFFIVNARDDEEAHRIAASSPCVMAGGSMEVRRVEPFPRPG